MKTYTIKRFNNNWDDIEYLAVDNVEWTRDYGIRAKMQIAYDDSKLYLHMIANEDDIRNELYGNEDRICDDSCMEIFFKVDERYFNFEVNFNCKYFVGIGKSREDNIRIVDDFKFLNARSSKTSDGWQIYYEIPYEFINKYASDFKPVKGYKMKANCYKCGDLCKHEHYITWNKVEWPTPDYHRPEYFGEMVFD